MGPVHGAWSFQLEAAKNGFLDPTASLIDLNLQACELQSTLLDSRSIYLVDIGFVIGTVPWALLQSLYGIHVLLAYHRRERGVSKIQGP